MQKGMSMKKYLPCLALVALLFSCSKEQPLTQNAFLDNAYGLASAKDGDDLSRFYTKETIAASKTYADKNKGTVILAGLDRKIFVRGSRFDLVNETNDGTRAQVGIRISAHPSPNMIGFETTISLKNESGVWKIDRAEEIKRLMK
jgi:hypothetical protein